MIRGLVVPELGAFILATVHLPHPLDRRTEVLFVVDTGSDRTVLMPRDLAPLGFDAALRESRGVIPARTLKGIGSAVATYAASASVTFNHGSEATSTFNMSLGLIDDPLCQDIPSILGRDILFRGQVSVGRDGLRFDVQPG